jgi:quercetin dioxygenase-like cupin family protein
MRGVKKAVKKLDDPHLSSRVEMDSEVKPATVTPITAEAQVSIPHDGLSVLGIVVDHRKSGKIPKHTHQTVLAGSLEHIVLWI